MKSLNDVNIFADSPGFAKKLGDVMFIDEERSIHYQYKAFQFRDMPRSSYFMIQHDIGHLLHLVSIKKYKNLPLADMGLHRNFHLNRGIQKKVVMAELCVVEFSKQLFPSSIETHDKTVRDILKIFHGRLLTADEKVEIENKANAFVNEQSIEQLVNELYEEAKKHLTNNPIDATMKA